MLGLRQKLLVGFAGLLAILLLVGSLVILLLNQASSRLERIFEENYNSVVYGQQMKEAIDDLDDLSQESFWPTASGVSETEQKHFALRFEKALALELGNTTLPGERQVALKIQEKWEEYSRLYTSAHEPLKSAEARRSEHVTALRPLGLELKGMAQQIIDMNLDNIVSADGEVRENTNASKRAVYFLLSAGSLVSGLLVWLMTRSILRPLQLVTESAREIERGNLDLTLKVASKDELGQLAEAFNAMARRLREFRRSDRAQLFRIQKTTQLALNSFPEAVAVIGLDGKVELANEIATKRFQLKPGYDLAKSEFKSLWDMFQESFVTLAPVRYRGYDKAIQQFFGGDEFFFLPQTVPIVDEGKMLTGVTLVLTDVTNLRRLDESKSGLLSVVSHELKTPLTSLRMATHLLLEERVGPLLPKQLDLILTARDDAERLNKIIENLLDMGRIESGRDLVQLSIVDPEKIVREAVDAFAGAARDRGIQLQNKVAEPLPRALVDSNRIAYVFANLIGNALKHTSAGGTITLEAKESLDEPGMLVFSVCDSGSGIPAEHHDKVFERFFRIPGSSAENGVGLGLAIAKDIVTAHGGKIWLEATPIAQGALFCFTLRSESAVNPKHA